ncbi:electron transfer flavoprotein alpha subunit [Dethiosulfatibacter aminovorans DSM 17477]|uniref:Electron transfer flavoprotein alpha subunit n=1 Tax=Dethiosulfatibacter aminovorans DSM 17477 TaxID=1121476 RepID=A0A1M6JM34_9FIRM|nr:electron transfer flavoprotein subunit alpha/FixB family protein [Dethiosulfatibacter aminovorans]SHJ47747.1 electron transfer flavoprotein alpha subunit [Dethiosulfatibacter aminovorans DSM 17477]
MDTSLYKGIHVYCETKGDRVIDNSLELLGEAAMLKEKMGQDTVVTAVIIGDDVEKHVETLARHGADKVVVVEDEKYSVYRPDYYAEALAKVADEYKPEIVLVGATHKGEEIGPTAAKILDTGMAAHCVELNIREDGEFLQVVPAFGGKVLGDILCPKHRPQMASMKAGLADKVIFEGKEAEVERFNPEVTGYGDKIEVIEVIEDTTERVSLSNAELIVAGGFGIGTQEGWDKLEKLAKLLHGATGCTRPALDEGWTEREETMVGTSGVAIKPKVYIGFGISGAAHHTCGIKGAGTIISVNRDKDAPIFDVSDYKVVSDWEKIVDALIEKLSE